MNDIGHFSLWGDFEVEEITRLLGMQPSWSMKKGDVLEGASSPAKCATWDIHCPPDTGDSAGEQICALLDMLWPKADVLKELTSRFHADLNVVSDRANAAVISLDREVLQKLAALNLTLNCFLYMQGDSE